MRILSQNSLLHGRRGLRASGLVGVALVCGSCAKFPPNGANGNSTAITFTFKVAGQINNNFIYDVAISGSSNPNPQPVTAPIPVINSSNPNGRMAGSPTEFIEYPSPSGPTSANPFVLYQFATQAQVPNPNDPTNPINIGVFAPSTLGQIFNFTTPATGGDPSTLTFTVYTNFLTDTADDTQPLSVLQVNILTMTTLASASGTRIIDGLGDSRTVSGLNNFLQINLLKTGTYSNSISMLEPTGDTFGGTEPDVDIVDYTITVTPP